MNKTDDQEFLISHDGMWCKSVYFGMIEYSTIGLLC